MPYKYTKYDGGIRIIDDNYISIEDNTIRKFNPDYVHCKDKTKFFNNTHRDMTLKLYLTKTRCSIGGRTYNKIKFKKGIHFFII